MKSKIIVALLIMNMVISASAQIRISMDWYIAMR